MEDFGSWLKERRKERGLSVPQLARLADIPESSVAKYESGTQPGFLALVKLAEALEVELLSGANITLDKTPSRVENLVDGIGGLDISDKEKSKLLMQALRVLETELG